MPRSSLFEFARPAADRDKIGIGSHSKEAQIRKHGEEDRDGPSVACCALQPPNESTVVSVSLDRKV